MAASQEIPLSKRAILEAVVARDRGECILCRREANDPHHIIPRRAAIEQVDSPWNLACLCREDHARVHGEYITRSGLHKMIGSKTWRLRCLAVLGARHGGYKSASWRALWRAAASL